MFRSTGRQGRMRLRQILPILENTPERTVLSMKGIQRIVSSLAVAGLTAFICQPLYMVCGQCDYILLALLVGIPFGIQRMFLWFIPCGYGIAGTVGMFALNILIGGMIGFFVFVYRLTSGAVMALASVKNLF